MSDTRKGLVACGLTWLLPGAGHAYLGRWRRGLAFLLLVGGTAAHGVLTKGNLSVVMAQTPVLSRLQVGVNLALGPAEPTLRKILYGELVYDRRGESDAVGRFVAERNRRASDPSSPYGTAYLWTAGLLNLLLLLDVYDLATGRKR